MEKLSRIISLPTIFAPGTNLRITRTPVTTWLFSFLVIVLFVFVVFSLWDIVSTTDFGESDFRIYWSATYLLHEGENPYSIELIKSVLQTQVDSTLDTTIMAWNPPFLFIFLLPLAWMAFTTAKFVWLLTNIILIITAGLMLTQIYMSAASPRIKLAFLIFVVGFPAVITGLYMGQVTFLVFWGLVACMTLIRKEQWFWAGAVLILTTIKPHIVILPVIYLLLYMARRRKYQGWAGLAIAGFFCFAILLMFRSDLLYNLLGETSVANGRWATSTIGGLLSYLGLTEAARYLILLLLPLPFLLEKHPEKISMELSVALLTLITIPTTFFGWSYDQTMLLIPIAQVFSWLIRSKYNLPIIICITCVMALNYFQRVWPINEVYYVWIPLIWWFIFGAAWRNVSVLNNNHV